MNMIMLTFKHKIRNYGVILVFKRAFCYVYSFPRWRMIATSVGADSDNGG